MARPHMSQNRRWLFSETERWAQARLITAEQAAQIRALYAEPESRMPWGLLLFTGLGAVVLGLGVILLLAYNWDAIPRFGKLALIFGSVIGAHAGAARLRQLDGWRPLVGEAVALLGTMLYGAGIWLVAQVYNIDEHYPNGFLYWGLGALAMAWAMDSVPQAIAAAVVLTCWGCAEVFGFHNAIDSAWWLVALGVGALAWRKRSAVLWSVVLASLYVLILSHAGFWGDESGVYFSALALSVALIAGRRLMEAGRRESAFGKVTVFFGYAGFMICAYLMTFEFPARHILQWALPPDPGWGAWLYRWGLPVGALAGWGWLLVDRWRGHAREVALEEWLCPITIFYSLGISLIDQWQSYELATYAFNLVVLGVAAAWMVRGCRSGRLLPTILGSLVLAVLVFARYFDLFENLAARGTAFLVLGAILFAEGFYYRKLRLEALDSEGGVR